MAWVLLRKNKKKWKCLLCHRVCYFTTIPVGQFLNCLSSWSGLNLTWQKLSLLKNQMSILGLRKNVFSAHYKSPALSLSFLLAVVLQAEPIPLVTSLKILFPWLKTRLVLFPRHFYDLHFLFNARKMNCNWGLHVSQELSAVVGKSLHTITAARN